MPFFSERTETAVWKKIQSNHQFKESLQVPENCPLNQCAVPGKREKRVLPFTSRVSGSITLEAALVLPLAVFFCVALIQPVLWLDRQRKVQTQVETLNEKLCKYAYLASRGGEKEETEIEEKSVYGNLLSGAAAGLWLKGKADETVGNTVVKRAEVLEENGEIILELAYRERIPFFEGVPGGVWMRAGSRRRAWIGRDGKLFEHGEDEKEPETGDERMVYVGAEMSRYHLHRDCHYISNQYTAVQENEAASMKNSYGARLTPCAVCKRDGAGGGEVYLTRESEHYHYSKNCPSMASYVRSVPLKEVEHLGLCSYCAGRGGIS